MYNIKECSMCQKQKNIELCIPHRPQDYDLDNGVDFKIINPKSK